MSRCVPLSVASQTQNGYFRLSLLLPLSGESLKHYATRFKQKSISTRDIASKR
jgi:hypothetical protein